MLGKARDRVHLGVAHLGAIRGPVASQGVALKAVLVPHEYLHAAVLWSVGPHVPGPHCVVLHALAAS